MNKLSRNNTLSRLAEQREVPKVEGTKAIGQEYNKKNAGFAFSLTNNNRFFGGKNCSSPEGDTSSSKRGTSFARLRAGSDSESQVRWGASHAAFTLIEVLLACVIVGVISALVLPVFVSKYRQKSFDLGFERQIKSLNNAIDALAITENKDYFKTVMYTSEEPETYESNSGQFIKKYLKLSKYCGDSNRDCFANIYYEYKNKDKKVYNPEFKGACGSLKNGSSICLTPQISANSPQVLIDINGKKGPNVLGQDLRTFTLNLKTRTAINTQTQDVIVPPPYERPNLSDDPDNPDDPDDPDEPTIDPPSPPSNPCTTDPNSFGCCQTKAVTSVSDSCCTYTEIYNTVSACKRCPNGGVFVSDSMFCSVLLSGTYQYNDAVRKCAQSGKRLPDMDTLISIYLAAKADASLGLPTTGYWWAKEGYWRDPSGHNEYGSGILKTNAMYFDIGLPYGPYEGNPLADLNTMCVYNANQ
ncbi:type II secretion system protein [bacterium]|nr:type II secretion system protein [bacterium]